MENLTKDSLNNQIVAMRNMMKRVKGLTINGLIKKSRKLKKSPLQAGSEPMKKDQKVDRLLMEINEIKKLNSDEIAKFALMHTGTFSEAAKKGSVKDRALARLAEHKLLTETVSQFRSKYPKWQVQVPSLFHIWEFNKKMVGKNLKPTQKDVAKNQKIEKEESPKKIKTSNNSNKAKMKKVIKPAASDKSLDGNSPKEVETEDASNVVNRPSLAQLSKDFKSKQSQDLKKTDGEIEIHRFNLNDVETEIPLSSAKKTKPKSDALTILKKSRVRNSFFITSDNEDATSSNDEVGKHSDVSENDEEEVQQKKCSSKKIFSKGTSFSTGRTRFQKHTSTTDLRNGGSASSRKEQGISSSERFRKPLRAEKWVNGRAATDSTNLPAVNLHPSWEAKRKQSNTLSVAFVGKKIKFGDD